MTTIPDSVKAQLDADWTAAGGTEPTYYVEEDFRTNPPLGQDAVWILSKTLDTGAKPVNDIYVDESHILKIIVTTKTSGDRLKELSDEVVRILNTTAIANVTYQRMKRRYRDSGEYQGIWVYQEIIEYDLREQMKSSAAAYGSGTTGDFTVVGDLTVGGNDIKDSGGASNITFDGSGNTKIVGQLEVEEATANAHTYIFIDSGTSNYDPQIQLRGKTTPTTEQVKLLYDDSGNKAYLQSGAGCTGGIEILTAAGNVTLDDGTDEITLTQIADLLMYGSANAAWVPCPFEGANLHARYEFDTDGTLYNVGGADPWAHYAVPLPPTKGTLKLYISGTRVCLSDADGTNFVTQTDVNGYSAATKTALDSDTTNKNTAQEWEDTFTAVDCSSYDAIKVRIVADVDTGGNLNIDWVSVRAYYA